MTLGRLSPVTSQPLLDGALAVAELDLRVHTNGADHSTGWFQRGLQQKALVVRRGQPFQICIRFNRKYTEDRDSISLIFTVDGTYRRDMSAGWSEMNLCSFVCIDLYLGCAKSKSAPLTVLLNILYKKKIFCTSFDQNVNLRSKLI